MRAAAALVLGTALVLVGCQRDGPDEVRLDAGNPQRIAQGQALYAAHCAACHGARLEGQPHWRVRNAEGLLPAPPHDATGHTWHHADEVLFRITKYGVARAANLKDYRSAMPAYEGVLSDEEIVAVLSFIKASWPERQRRAQEEVDRAERAAKARSRS